MVKIMHHNARVSGLSAGVNGYLANREIKMEKICLKCGEKMIYEDASWICPECKIEEEQS